MSKQRVSKGIALVGDIQVASGKVQKVLIGTVARTDTSAKSLGTLPKGATLIGVQINVPTVSNAATTATVSVGYNGGTGIELANAKDVKAAAGQFDVATAALTGSALAAAQTVVGIYAETGTASSSGGPFQVVVEYVTV